MLTFQDMVHRFKNVVKMRNVYDCVRPILFLFSLFGVGASRMMKIDGVYSLRYTRYSIIVGVFTVICTPLYLVLFVVRVLVSGTLYTLVMGVAVIIAFLLHFLRMVSVSLGCIRTHVCCKDLDKVFQIINNIDTKLQQENIKINHWKITLEVIVFGLVTASYMEIAHYVHLLHYETHYQKFELILGIIYTILFHLYYVWVILFLLIIYERFVAINKLFLENARVTNIRIVGSRNMRDDYLLRRISLARDMDEQLSQAIVLFSNVFRYMIAGILMHPIIRTLYSVIVVFFVNQSAQLFYVNMFHHFMRIVIMISICEAYKNQRKVQRARLRHLIAHEADRRIIQQVQQYIMYSATSVTGLIDFQFTEVDNTLLFTIIDILASNALVIYSYARMPDE